MAFAAYVLSDGTILPQLQISHYDFFAWQIIEHAEAKKTVFLFPDTGTNLDGAPSKLLIMNEIADANHNRQISVLLELLDNGNDKDRINRFSYLREQKAYCDFSKIVSASYKQADDTAKMRAAMNSSMALFYQNLEIEVLGAEDKREIEKYMTQQENVEKEIENKYKEYRQVLLKEFYSFYTLRTELFIRRIEDEIIDSAKRKGISNSKRIIRINALQREFAKLFLSREYLDILLAKYEDKRIEKILASIDEICGSYTVEKYKHYKEEVMQSWHSHVSAENLAKLKEYKQKLIREQTDEIISGSFASLKDGTVGICELGVTHIYNQIELCMKNKEYNLVVFYHPGLSSLSHGYTQAQNPKDHEQMMAQYGLNDDFFNQLMVPKDFAAAVEEEPRQGHTVREKYILFRALPLEGDSMQQGKSVIDILKLPAQGELIRLIRMGEDGNVFQEYYFIPEKVNEETGKSYTELFSETDVTAQEQKLLQKYFEIEHAARDL